MPLGQHGILTLRRQFQVKQIFRCSTQSRRDENHPLRVDGMDVTNGFIIHPIKRRLIMVELIRGFKYQVETQQRRALTKVMRHRHPPVNHLFFVTGAGVFFIFVSLIGDYRDHAILLTGFHQFTQVYKPRLRGLSRHANAHVGQPFRLKIPHHQRIEFTYTPIGARPVYVHPNAKLLRILRRRQRRLRGIYGGAG